MKKRVKLFTTIASLCMAIALMAFGVYAATTATLNVTSTINFATTGVNVEWTVTVSGAKDEAANTSHTETFTSDEIAANTAVTDTIALGALNMTAGTQLKIVVKCTNKGGSAVTVTPTVSFTNDNVKYAGETTAKDIAAKDNSVEFTYTFDIIDASVEVDGVAFNPSFAAAQKA